MPQDTDQSLDMDDVQIVLEEYKQESQNDSNEDHQESKGGAARRAPQPSLEEQPIGQIERWCPWLTLRPLAPYFQVDSKTVGRRVLGSLIPFNRQF